MRKITNKKLLNQATHIESYIPNVIIIIEYNLISNYSEVEKDVDNLYFHFLP